MSRLALLGLILLGQFAVLEAGLRTFGGRETDAEFQSLFLTDDRIGYRLRPGAHVRYSTGEFSTDIAINHEGVRDDQDLGPKAPGERRVLILGDSYVFAIQVPFQTTFGEQLEQRLNQGGGAARWRVINGGVQGYGPVEQWLFYKHVASRLAPDVVVIFVSVATDAVEAFDAKAKLEIGHVPEATAADQRRSQLRRLVRSSVVLQLARVRADQLRARVVTGTAERPVATYLEHPPDFVIEGLRVAADAFGRIAADARAHGAQVAFVLMPARFQIADAEFERLAEGPARAGKRLLQRAATDRFAAALAPLGEPMLDLLPILEADDNPRSLFFRRNGHLSPQGHRVAAESLFAFLRR